MFDCFRVFSTQTGISRGGSSRVCLICGFFFFLQVNSNQVARAVFCWMSRFQSALISRQLVTFEAASSQGPLWFHTGLFT